MKVYFVRHAQRDFGINFDRLLTQGIWQAKKLGPLFSKKKIDVVYCSPQNRAKQTLKEILPYLSKDVQIKTSKQVRQQSAPEEVGEDVIRRLKIKKESNEETFSRARKFIRYLLKKHPNETVLVISHKMFIRFICSNLIHRNAEDFKIKSASVTFFDINKNGNIKSYRIGEAKHYSDKYAKLITNSYLFARERHRNQKMKNGRDYIEHPGEVGRILAKWGQDYQIICAGILHDLVEDTNTSLFEIRRKFGNKIAFYVDGVSWIGNKENNQYEEYRRKTYQKFINNSKKDCLQILVKAADVLYWILEDKNKKVITHKTGQGKRTFWIPFFKEVGLNKLARLMEKDINRYSKKKISPILHEYISRKELEKIRISLSKLKGIDEIR